MRSSKKDCRSIVSWAGVLVVFLLLLIHPLFGAGQAGLILPAQSLGTISIGQDFMEVQKALGEPRMSKPVQNGTLVKFEKQGIIVQYSTATNKVQFAGIDAGAYKTKEGLTIGSKKSQVEAQYSTPVKMIPITSKDFYPRSQEAALYISRGIAFHYDAAGTVVVIIVFDPALFGG
jgi:hypothetical protein